ncbi:MAG: hypothetical protein ABR886_06850 [Dehalococcoidales bacterium]|jgi:pimeloyl-ACP methyl ester carboxylesterase
MPRVKVGDINMYYEIHGKGEPFVYINGQGGTVETLLPGISSFTNKYRVLIYDCRGAGRTDAPDIPLQFPDVGG